MKSKALKIFRSIFAVITVFSLLVTGMPVIALDGDTAEFKEIYQYGQSRQKST